jgi:hypothetical protein
MVNDFNADGHYEMLTVEAAAGGAKVGVRSTSTGALLAQTVGIYEPTQFWITYLEPTNEIAEIIFADQLTGNLVCVNYTTGATTLPVRWSFMPTPSGLASLWTFIDFDGNGQLSMVFKDPAANTPKYYIRDNNAALVTTIDQSAQVPSGWTAVSLNTDAFENPNRQSLMILYDFGPGTPDYVYLYASNAPPPPVAPAGTTGGSSPVRTAAPRVRTFVRANGAWAESALPSLAATTSLHPVALP